MYNFFRAEYCVSMYEVGPNDGVALGDNDGDALLLTDNVDPSY